MFQGAVVIFLESTCGIVWDDLGGSMPKTQFQ